MFPCVKKEGMLCAIIHKGRCLQVVFNADTNLMIMGSSNILQHRIFSLSG